MCLILTERHELTVFGAFQKPQTDLISLRCLINVNLNLLVDRLSLNSYLMKVFLRCLHMIALLLYFYLDGVIPDTYLHLDRIISLAND